MWNRLSARTRKITSLTLATALVAGAAFLIMPSQALAHCDSAQGPVVTAAYQALEKGHVNLALPYVKADAEAEVKAAFDHAMAVRKLGGEAQNLADQYFAETVVRLHRVGEGASYTGIKENPEITPGLEAAEKAVATGDLNEVYKVLDEEVKKGIAEYWHKVQKARELARKEGTVAAERERAEAELIFEKFVFGVEQAARGLTHGEEGSAAGGHSHGVPAEAAHAAQVLGCSALADGAEVKLAVNGKRLAMAGKAEGHKLMVPLRAAVEAAGGEILWDGQTRSVTVHLGHRELSLRIGASTGTLNGKQVLLPVAPVTHDGRTFVSGELLVDGLGFEQECMPHEGAVHYTAH